MGVSQCRTERRWMWRLRDLAVRANAQTFFFDTLQTTGEKMLQLIVDQEVKAFVENRVQWDGLRKDDKFRAL